MNFLSPHITLLQTFLHTRLKNYFSHVVGEELAIEESQATTYLFAGITLTHDEYYTLLLALVPHIQPALLDASVHEFLPNGGEFTEFGGVKSGNYRGMLPTGETALFLLAGNNIERRMDVQQLFSADHFFSKSKILWLEEVKEGEPRMSGRIILSQEWLEHAIYGKVSKPNFGTGFPAKLLETKMTWDDIVLNPNARQQIDMVATWVTYNDVLMQDENLGRKIRPGYKVLFYGPSGTGKTLTASLIGKQFDKDVYRIDLSQVVSKFIGETEKNLEQVFSKAQDKEWILFFDEADALFGKRTGVQSSNDRYANQEVSYLLQRIEDFSGLVILASNLKNNIDQAFLRRFNQIIHFPAPNAEERLMIWKKMLPSSMPLHEATDVHFLAQKYEITGAAIVSVIHYAALQALKRKDKTILQSDLVDGIRREYHKEERLMN